MLQPDKLKKLNDNALKMAQAGKSKEDIIAMKDAFIAQFGTEDIEKGDLSKINSPKNVVPKIDKKIQSVLQSPENVAKYEHKLAQVNKLQEDVYAPDEAKAEQMTKDQEEGNGFWNTMKGVGNAIASVPEKINKAFDPNNTHEAYQKGEIDTSVQIDHPFQEQINQVKKLDKDNILTEQEVLAKARELKKIENQKVLTDHKVTHLMTNADDETKDLLNANAINKATSLNTRQKSISGQISILRNKHAQASDEEKPIIEQQINALQDEANKVDNKKITANDAVRQFALNYNPVANFGGKALAGIEKMGGKALYALGSLDKSIGGYDDNVFTVSGEKLVKAGEDLDSKFHQESLESIANSENPVYDLGRYAVQAGAGLVPYATLGAENAIVSGASKVAVIASGAGGKTMEMHNEMKADPSIKYTPAQIFLASAGYAGAEALMAGELGTMFKGSKGAVSSILKNPVAREQFEQGVRAVAKESLDGVAKMGGKMIHSAKLGASMEAIKIYTDETVLGKHIDNKGAKIMSGAIEMAVLPLLLEAFPAVAGHYTAKLSPKVDIVAVHNNVQKIKEFTKSLDDPTLTLEAKTLIKTSIQKLNTENETTLKKSYKAIQNLTPAQIENLLTIDGRKAEIRKEVDAIKDPKNNAPNNVKAQALADKKAEWNKLEDGRMDVFENKHNALDTQTEKEKDRLNSDAEESLQNELNPNREKALKLTPEQIKERASEIHKTEQLFNGMNIKEIDALKRTAMADLVNKLTDKQKEEGYKITNYEVVQQVIKNEKQKVKDAEAKSTVVETEPQTEVPQQAEAEKIDVEKTKYRIAELNNELEQNRIRGEKGEISNRSNKEIKAEIAELESKLPKEEIVTLSVSESFNQAGENAKSKQDGKVIGRWILDNSKIGDTITLSDGTGYEITNSKNGEIEITPFETNEKGEREYIREGVRLVTENQLKQGDLFESSYENNKGERITEKYSYNEAISKPQEVSPVEDVVAPKQPDNVIKVEPAQKVEIIDESLPKTDNSTDGKIPSLEEAEYKEFVNNNIVSNERLVDIADKVKKAEKLTPYENSIFHGKTSDINKIIADEKLSPTNTPTNGNVQLGASNVGESGVTEPKSTSKESVQRAVDGGESKVDVEISDVDHAKSQIEKGVTYVDENGTEYTALKKAVYDAEREFDGKEVVNTTNEKSPTEVRNDVESKIKSGEITETEIRDIATGLAKGENISTKLTGEQIEYALLHDKVTIQKEARRIESDLEKAISEGDFEKQAELLLLKAQNELWGDENYVASKSTGSEASRIMHAKKAGLSEDYSYRNILDRVQEIAQGKDVPQEVKDAIKKESRNIEDLQAKIDEYQSKFNKHEAEVKKLQEENDALQEKISKTKAEEKLEKLKNLKSKTGTKKEVLEQKRKATVDQIRAKYKKLSGTLNAGINPKFLELAPDIALLAKIHVEMGLVKLEDVIGQIMIDLDIPELTERDIRDMFSGYGKSTKPNNDPNAKTLAQLKSKARALSGLEDVKNLGEAPLRSGVTHRPPTEEVKALRREIHREMREQGIDFKNVKDKEQTWKTALESYKTRIGNRIEYLENISKSNDVEKFLREKKKTKLKLDNDARELKVKQQKIKNKVDDMVAKADFETWSKFRKARHYGIRYAKGNLISAPTTLIKILGSVAWRTAYKAPTAIATYGVSKLRPDLAKVEGINTVKDLTQHIVDYYKTEFSMKNVVDFYKTFKNHSSAEEILFGKHHTKAPLPKIRDNKSLNVAQKLFFSHLKFLEDISASSHGAIKNLVSLPEYEAYKNTIMRNLIRDGIPKDMLDNGSVEQIAHQLAFAKSQRARFGQDNVISSAKSEWIAKLNNKKHHLTADILDAAMPIVKIGSNYVGETLEKYPLIGLIPNGKNMFKSSDLLTSKQQSDLLRTLAYQGVGTMSFLAGAMLYKNISAFFGTDADEYAKKQNPHLAEHDGAIGFLSHLYSHSPDAEAMRIGASFMWYWDMYDKKNNGDKEPMSDLMMATFENTLGVVNQSPYITTAENTISPLLDSKKDGGKVGANFVRPRLPFGDFAKTIAQGQIPILDKVSPELGNEIAKKLGMNPETVKPYEIGLRPKGFIDNFGIGIPGWRDKILKDIYNEKYNTPKEPKSGEEYQQSQQDKQDKEYKKQQFQNEH